MERCRAIIGWTRESKTSLLVARVRFGCGPDARPGHPAYHGKGVSNVDYCTTSAANRVNPAAKTRHELDLHWANLV